MVRDNDLPFFSFLHPFLTFSKIPIISFIVMFRAENQITGLCFCLLRVFPVNVNVGQGRNNTGLFGSRARFWAALCRQGQGSRGEKIAIMLNI